MTKTLKITVTQDEQTTSFQIDRDAQISNMEILGMIEMAKQTIIQEIIKES